MSGFKLEVIIMAYIKSTKFSSHIVDSLSQSSEFSTLECSPNSFNLQIVDQCEILVPKENRFFFSYPSESSLDEAKSLASRLEILLCSLEDSIIMRDEPSVQPPKIILMKPNFSSLTRRRTFVS